MTLRSTGWLAAALGIVATCAVLDSRGADVVHRDLRLSDVHIVAPPPGARTAGAYLVIENRGKDADALVRVESPLAASAEVHEMSMDGNMMRMRAIARLPVPAGARVELKSGAYHLMLQDLKRPLRAGEEVPLTVTFEKAGPVQLNARVEAAGSRGKR